MLKFSNYLQESKKQDPGAYHVEMYLWDKDKSPLFRVIKTESNYLSEAGKAYTPDEKDVLAGEMYQHLSTFKPSSFDHETITREFHQHLANHGLYMHTDTHPLVMSPKDQKFKSEFKKFTARTEKGKQFSAHELPHHDGSPGKVAKPGAQTMGRFVGLWSTKGPTNVYDPKSGEQIKDASQAGKVTVINDEKVKHAASGETNRWFIRAGEIRKIPQSGSVNINGTRHKVKNGKFVDMDSYIGSKKYNVPKHQQNVNDYFKNRRDYKDSPAPDSEKKKTLNWMKENHPEFHQAYTEGNIEKRGNFIS